MTTNLNKKKETNLLLLKKDSNYNTSIQELNPISFNFHLNDFHKKNNSKTGRLYNHYNNITKVNNNQNKNTEHSIINTYIKNSSPTTNFKSSNIDTSNSNTDLTNALKTKENITNREYSKDLQYKKHFHHKKINSYLLIKNNQVLSELFPNNITTNTNKTKNYIFKNQNINGIKTLRKKHIQIDINNINNNTNNHTNINNTTKKIINHLSNNNNNNHHKINLKIYLEKHQRVLSTDSNNNNNKSININSKNKKNEKFVKNNNNINSVIKNKRLITNKNSQRLLNNYRNNTLSRANSSWINKEYNIFNTSIEHSISKYDKIKKKNKSKKNNVIIENINNYIKEKKLKNYNNNEYKKNDILHLNKLKEKTTLFYLTNISEELKSKKKNYNANNIFISINNYSNDNKKKGSKNNINLTEGKEINIQNYITKKSTSLKGISKNKRRNHLIKIDNKNKILYDSKNSSQNKTEENYNSTNSNNDKIDGPEQTHFFLVASIQKGIKNINKYN